MVTTGHPPLLSHERARFVDDLISYMTLEEKLGQLNLAHSPQDPRLEAAIVSGHVGGVAGGEAPQRLQALATEHSRLGIPLLISAPVPDLPLSPWALAASWDEDLANQLGAVAADIARGAGANTLRGPGIVIGADPEPAGHAQIACSESHLAARLAAAFGNGAGGSETGVGYQALAISKIEGSAIDTLRCGLDLAFGGRMAAVDCDELGREAALKAGFYGLLSAECRRLVALLSEHFETTSSRSPIEAAEKAIAEGLVREHEIDGAVRGVLVVKHALGLFNSKGRPPAIAPANDEFPTSADIARRCMVLLRNESGLLPLSPVSDRVLVVGAADGLGGACADALSRAGIGHSMAPGLALRGGSDSWSNPVAGDQFALSLTRDAAQRVDFVLVALEGRHFTARGPGRWRQPGAATMAMLRGLSTTTSRLVALIGTNEPVDLAEADQHFSAVLHCWEPGAGFAEALADILSGRNSPQGRLPTTAGRFEFGHGLGYGETVFSSLSVKARGDHVAASIRLRNSGSFPARETVQAYVRGAEGELRLVGFEHVTLGPGEDVPVGFELGIEALGEPGAGHRLELRPGLREILVGKNIGRLLAARVDITPSLARAIRRQDQGALRLATG